MTGIFDETPRQRQFPEQQYQPRPVPASQPVYHDPRPARAHQAQQYFEPSPQDLANASLRFWKRLVAIVMSLGLLAVIGIGVVLWFVLDPGKGVDRDRSVVNPATYFIEEYAAGMSELYSAASEAAANGEFKDIVEARDFIKTNKSKVDSEAFKEMKDVLEGLNGSGWSDDDAAEVFEMFSEGFDR